MLILIAILLKSMQHSDIESVKSGTIDEITHVQDEDLLDDDAVNNNNSSLYINSTVNTSIDQNINNRRIEEEIEQNVTVDTTTTDILKEDSNSALILHESTLAASPQRTVMTSEIPEAASPYSDSSSSSASENSQAKLNSIEYASNGSQSANTNVNQHGHDWDDENSWDESGSEESLMDTVIPFSKAALKTVPFMGGYFGFTLGRDETHYLTILNGASGGRTVILELPNKEKILLDTPIIGCRKTALDTFDVSRGIAVITIQGNTNQTHRTKSQLENNSGTRGSTLSTTFTTCMDVYKKEEYFFIEI
jgi:hypothetical protein